MGTTLSASSACAVPSSQKARAKEAKSGSRVRFQKRRNIRPATRKPMVIAPERKLNSISVLPVPEEAEQQHADGGQRGQGPDQRQVDIRKDQYVEDHGQAVAGKEQEAERAPEQQPGPRPPIGAREQQCAGARGQEAEHV